MSRSISTSNNNQKNAAGLDAPRMTRSQSKGNSREREMAARASFN